MAANIDALSVNYLNETHKEDFDLGEGEVTPQHIPSFLQELESEIRDAEIYRGDFSLSIEFAKNRSAFIGWYDECNDEFYYPDNGSGNTEPVDLLVNVCPEERFLCYEMADIKAIVAHFCETGERSPHYTWVLDEC